MAGGGSSWQDLALYLIARFVGLKEAMEVAKVYMLQWHDLGQQPFAALAGLRADARCRGHRCQDWLASNYDRLAGDRHGRRVGLAGTLFRPALHQGDRA